MSDSTMLILGAGYYVGAYFFVAILFVNRIVASVLIGRWRTLAIPPSAPFSFIDIIRIAQGICIWPLFLRSGHLIEMVRNYRDHGT